MKTIQFYILKSPYKKIPPGLIFNNPEDQEYPYTPVFASLEGQAKEFSVDIEVSEIEITEIPTRANSYLIVFLDQNSIIPQDYIARILSMNNLHTNAAAFCGPVFTEKSVHKIDWFISKISSLYKRYSLDGFDSFISCRLNDDEQNFPPISGSIFSGSHYTKIGGIKCISSRYPFADTQLFLQKAKDIGEIIYSSRLSTGYFITTEELEIENFSKYYYQLGYSDGLKSSPEKMNHQFAQNQNLLEIESLSWATQNEEVKENKEYIKHIAIFKCLYEVGFFEAFTGSKLI
jgi:hypothetical protein